MPALAVPLVALALVAHRSPLLAASRSGPIARSIARTSAIVAGEPHPQQQPQQLGPIAAAEDIGANVEIELEGDDAWQVKLASPEVQALRQKLIDQYLALDRSEEYAIKEVDEFLSDPSRSAGWVKAQELQNLPGWGFGDDKGAGNQVYFFAACFLAGIVLQAGAKYLGSLTGATPSS